MHITSRLVRPEWSIVTVWLAFLLAGCLFYTVWLFGIFQNEVRILLNVGKSSRSLFRVILKYINPGTEAVSGRVTIYPSWAEAGRQRFKPLLD